MKFFILALFIAAANAGAVWPYSAWHAPVVSGPIAQIASHPWAPHVGHVVDAPAHVAYSAPYAWNHAHYAVAPAHYAVAPAHIPAVAATYKAQTLGATHVAPLPGHTIDRANLNLAAPPTH